MAAPKVLVINGPNLDMLGEREPEIYGSNSLAVLESTVRAHAAGLGIETDFFQSNSEGDLINAIHGAAGTYSGIVYNPGAHTHYSYALRDAVASVSLPVVEVHLSDVGQREAFRNGSVIAPACVARIKGLGIESYCRAIDVFISYASLRRLGERYWERYVEKDGAIVGTPEFERADGQLSPEQAAGLAAQPAPEPQPAPEQQPPLEQQAVAALAPMLEQQVVPEQTPALGQQAVPEQAPAFVQQPVPDQSVALGQQPEQPAIGQPAEQLAAGQLVENQPVAGQLDEQPISEQTAAGQQTPDSPLLPDAASAPVNALETAAMPAAEPQFEAVQAANAAEGSMPAIIPEPIQDKGLVQQDDAAEAAGQVPAAPADFTQPFAQEIASYNAGLESFERQSIVVAASKRLSVDAFYIRDTPSIQWITALDGVFDSERAHALLVVGGGSRLHTDSRYSNAMRARAAAVESDIIVHDERKSHGQFALDMLSAGAADGFKGMMGIEDSITYGEFVQLAQTFGMNHLVPTKDVIVGLRARKRAFEVPRLKAAQAVTDAAFAHIVSFMRPGMTEREVQVELDYFMMRHGAEGLAFPTIVATGENGADPHAVPGSTKLEAGQCVVLDFGAKAYGYCSDMTRTVFLGEPDEKKAHAWKTLRYANESVERMLCPGVTGKQAHELAERILAENGFAGKMGHGLGHGVGLEIHELPVLNPRNESPLAEGNVVTVEPGIYLPGEFGMRLEDFGIVTATGFEVFTQSTHEMVVI